MSFSFTRAITHVSHHWEQITGNAVLSNDTSAASRGTLLNASQYAITDGRLNCLLDAPRATPIGLGSLWMHQKLDSVCVKTQPEARYSSRASLSISVGAW
jgi:hypothetical protein